MLSRNHLLVLAMAILVPHSASLSLSSYSKFHGTSLGEGPQASRRQERAIVSSSGLSSLTMRKQKASDRRTRRLQRGGEELAQDLILESLRNTITSSPMELTGAWSQKRGGFPSQTREKTGGRGRSRKRATLYNSLSSYHNKFFTLLTAEYSAEVRMAKLLPDIVLVPGTCTVESAVIGRRFAPFSRSESFPIPVLVASF